MPSPPGTRRPVLVEACVTSAEEAEACVSVGAGRLELCVDLDAGGRTPPRALVDEVVAGAGVPVFAMARPRAGSFVHAPREVVDVLRDVEALLAAGCGGVVVGFLEAGGGLDLRATEQAVAAAGGRPVTFHRAFDETADPAASLRALASAGVARVLTGGGPGAARLHADTLAALVRAAGEDLEVLVGGGVRGDHVRHLVSFTGAREVHARASGIPGVCRALFRG